MKSPQTPGGSTPSIAGTGTSSIRWPRNVALARISTSRNREADCRGIAASLSRRCSRQGEWTSSAGTAKSHRQGRVASQRPTRAAGARGRLPMTWSQVLIDSSRGRRCASVQNAEDAETSTRGSVAPCKPSSIARFQPRASASTTTASARLPSRFSRATRPSATSSGACEPGAATTMTRTSAVGSGSRRAWAANGSSVGSAAGGVESAAAAGFGLGIGRGPLAGPGRAGRTAPG